MTKPKPSRRGFDVPSDLGSLKSEGINPRSRNLDTLSSLDIARIINKEDMKVAAAIETQLPAIAKAINIVAAALASGGRLIYVGTGTSGRIGALDAAECAPTFSASPEMVQYVIAGGPRALGQPIEASEDVGKDGERDIARKKLTRKDVILGLAASGRTPYTVAAVAYARKKGARTIALTANPNTPLARVAEHAIVIEVGPEVIAGSTRMKAGTMQKMVLNMISTGAFTRLGYVYDNLMVNTHLKNAKLIERGIRILQQLTGMDREPAIEALHVSGWKVSVALVMFEAGVGRKEAERLLEKARGNVRVAIGGKKP